MAPYILASPRAVATPFTDGISASRNGISPCTTAFMPGKYMAPNPAEYSSAAILGATKLKIGLAMVFCGARICAGCVGVSAGGGGGGRAGGGGGGGGGRGETRRPA